MPGLLPQALIQNLRAFDLEVAVVAIHTTHVLLDLLPHGPSLGMPKHGAWRVFIDVEQIQLAPKFSVVTLFSLFQPNKVLLQVIFAGPGCAINALQHFIAVVAAPIGTGNLHELEMFEFARTRNMGATAKVFEIALAVQAHILIRRDARNDLCFVVFTQPLKVRDSLIARQDTTYNGFVFVGQFGHALFNRGQVLRGKTAAV